MIYLFDRDLNPLALIPRESVIEAYFTESVSGPKRLQAEIIHTIGDSSAVYVGHLDYHSGNQIHLYRIENLIWGRSGLDIRGVEMLYDDLRADGIVRDLRPAGRSVRELFGDILEGTEWVVGAVDTTQAISGSIYYQSRLEAISGVLERYGLEMRARVLFNGRRIYGRYLDVWDSEAVDRGRRFAWGSGLLDIVSEDSRENCFTAGIGRGKGEEIGDGFGRRITFSAVEWSKAGGDPENKPFGQDWVEVEDYTSAFGYPEGKPRIQIMEFPDIEDPEELLEATYRAVLDRGLPRVLYRTSLEDPGDVEIGEKVSIIREDWGIRYQTRIVRKTTDLLRPDRVDAEIGEPVQNPTLESLRNLKTEQKIQENQVETALQRVRELAEVQENLYWGEDGWNYDLKADNEYNLPAGFYSFDAPIDSNPSKFVYVGAGRVVISNERTPAGEWVIKTIVDGTGLSADTVGALQIQSGAVQTDHLTADGIDANRIRVSSGSTLSDKLADLDDSIDSIELTPGPDGKSSHLHIAYADNASGGGMNPSPAGKTYIGYAVTETSTRPTTAGAYIWAKYAGDPGPQGDPGIQGPPGEDGSERWIWIKYADDVMGGGITDNPEGKDFIGVAGNKLTQTESSDPEDYVWSRINDHANVDEAITYYTEIKEGRVILGQVQDVHDRVENTEGSIQIINNALVTKVEDDALKETKETIERILDGKANASELEGLATGWVEQVNSINQFKLDYKGLETRVDDGEEINQLVTRSLTWDENWLSIGADNSSTQMQITNEALNVIDGGEISAYFAGQQTYVENMIVNQDTTMGNHTTSKYGTNGEITVERWNG